MARKPKVKRNPAQIRQMARQLKRYATVLERKAQSDDYAQAVIAVTTLGMATRLLRDAAEG